MKYIQILRHAKSSWKDLKLHDHDRELNKRGKRTAPIMAQRLSQKPTQPQLILSSTAKRAYLTAKIIAKGINYPVSKIKINQSLYHASVNELLLIISQTKNTINNLMLVGHNPGLNNLVNQLFQTHHYFDNIPTAGLLTVSVDITSWQQVLKNSLFSQVELLDYDYPKKYQLYN